MGIFNIQSIRNNAIAPTKAEAINQLKNRVVLDGTPVIIRYEGADTTNTGDSAILGFAYRTSETAQPIYAYIDLDNDSAINALKAEDININQLIKSLQDTVNTILTRINSGFVTEKDAIEVTQKADKSYVVGIRVDGTTIKVVNGKLSVPIDAFTTYSGSNAIKVAETDAKNDRQISLILDEANKFLKITEKGLYADLKLNLTAKKTGNFHEHFIQLLNSDNALLSEINAEDFIMDGLLDSVDIQKEGADNTEYLVFTFNTGAGKNQLKVNLGQYINSYNAGKGIDITSRKVSVVMKDNTYLDVTDADGIKFKMTKNNDGTDISVLDKSINDRINTASNNITNESLPNSIGKRVKTLETNLATQISQEATDVSNLNTRITNVLSPKNNSGLQADGTSLKLKIASDLSNYVTLTTNGLDWYDKDGDGYIILDAGNFTGTSK